MKKPPARVTAEMLWINHRAILGGDNAKSGADGRPLSLPYLLSEAPPGVQSTHYGMACVVAIVSVTEYPRRPDGVTEERAREILTALEIKQTC